MKKQDELTPVAPQALGGIHPIPGDTPIEQLQTADYVNVVALAGVSVQAPNPEGLTAARIIAHKDEQIAELQDLCARQAQQLQDELDQSADHRPDLLALLEECDQVLRLGEAV